MTLYADVPVLLLYENRRAPVTLILGPLGQPLCPIGVNITVPGAASASYLTSTRRASSSDVNLEKNKK